MTVVSLTEKWKQRPDSSDVKYYTKRGNEFMSDRYFSDYERWEKEFGLLLSEAQKQAKTFTEIHEWIANAIPNHWEMRRREAIKWLPFEVVASEQETRKKETTKK